jgi:hypothetical protein
MYQRLTSFASRPSEYLPNTPGLTSDAGESQGWTGTGTPPFQAGRVLLPICLGVRRCSKALGNLKGRCKNE